MGAFDGTTITLTTYTPSYNYVIIKVIICVIRLIHFKIIHLQNTYISVNLAMTADHVKFRTRTYCMSPVGTGSPKCSS